MSRRVKLREGEYDPESPDTLTRYDALYEDHEWGRYGRMTSVAGRLLARGIPHPEGHLPRRVRVVIGGTEGQMLPIEVYGTHADQFSGNGPQIPTGSTLKLFGIRLTRLNRHYARGWCLGRGHAGRYGRCRVEPAGVDVPEESAFCLLSNPIALGDIRSLQPVSAPLVAVSGTVKQIISALDSGPSGVSLSDLSGRRKVWVFDERTDIIRELGVGARVRLERVHLTEFRSQIKGGRTLEVGMDTVCHIEELAECPGFRW